MLALFQALSVNESLDRKYVLAVLYDLLQHESTKQFVRETAWSQGIEQLLATSYLAEPVATAFIFRTVNADSVLRG